MVAGVTTQRLGAEVRQRRDALGLTVYAAAKRAKLSDSGGRTMIADVPAPQCAGSTSPFLPQARYVRRVF